MKAQHLEYVLLGPAVVGAIVAAAGMFAGGVYGYIGVGSVSFHAATLMVLSLSYALLVLGLRRIPFLWRPAAACLFVALAIHLYDSLWGVVSLAFRGGPLPLGGFLGAGTAALVLWRLNRRMDVVRPNYAPLALFLAASAMCLVALGWGGYFGVMTLYDAGLGLDPNVSQLWLLSKIFALFSPVYLVNGRAFGVVPS